MKKTIEIILRAGLFAAFLITLSTTFVHAQFGGGPPISTPPGVGACGGSFNLSVIGLTSDGRLICFTENDPGSAFTLGTVTGLTGDTALIGIDFRVQNGSLYGVGNAGGIYVFDVNSVVGTKIGQLTVALQGTFFGVDFNPAANALRIISDTGQNLRQPFSAIPLPATVVDGTLTYTPPTMTPVAALGVTGAAYTNNDLSTTTATTLFDIDTNLDQVVIQSPANNGLLVATGMLTVNTGATVGFDIYSSLDGSGATVDNLGFASLTVGSGTGFYGISLLTGRATFRGSFSSGNQVTDIAVPLNQF